MADKKSNCGCGCIGQKRDRPKSTSLAVQKEAGDCRQPLPLYFTLCSLYESAKDEILFYS
jgi:hypothetical protein